MQVIEFDIDEVFGVKRLSVVLKNKEGNKMYKLYITLGNRKIGEVNACSLSALSRGLRMWAQNHMATIDDLNQWYRLYANEWINFELLGRDIFRGDFKITSKTELECGFEII